MRAELQRFAGREVNTTGDGFIAAFDSPTSALRCGERIVAALAELGVEVRVGLHAGECEIRGGDLAGMAVHIAARVAATARPGEVVVSKSLADLVLGSGLEFDDRGTHELKGVPGSWALVALRPQTPTAVRFTRRLAADRDQEHQAAQHDGARGESSSGLTFAEEAPAD